MTVGVWVWYSGEEFYIDFLLLFVFLYIPEVLPVLLPNDLNMKCILN